MFLVEINRPVPVTCNKRTLVVFLLQHLNEKVTDEVMCISFLVTFGHVYWFPSSHSLLVLLLNWATDDKMKLIAIFKTTDFSEFEHCWIIWDDSSTQLKKLRLTLIKLLLNILMQKFLHIVIYYNAFSLLIKTMLGQP